MRKRAGWGDICLARTKVVLPRGPLCLNCQWVTITTWLHAWVSQVLSLRKPFSVTEGMAKKPLHGSKGGGNSLWTKGILLSSRLRLEQAKTFHVVLQYLKIVPNPFPDPLKTHATSPTIYSLKETLKDSRFLRTLLLWNRITSKKQIREASRQPIGWTYMKNWEKIGIVKEKPLSSDLREFSDLV